MGEIKDYPYFIGDAIILSLNASNNIPLSPKAYDYSIFKSNKYPFTWQCSSSDGERVKLSIKSRKYLIAFTSSYDFTYSEITIIGKDSEERQVTKIYPTILANSPVLYVMLNNKEKGTIYTLTELIAQHSFYEGFTLNDCNVLPLSFYPETWYYTDNKIQILDDSIKIIGEISYGESYALVDAVNKRAMILKFEQPTE